MMIPYLYELSFYLIAGISILSAILVVHLKKLMHSAMFLGVLLVTVGELYLLLGAEFLGVIQILVYAGGVTVVMLFALMLAPHYTNEPQQLNPFRNIAIALLIISLSALYLMVLSGQEATPPTPSATALTDYASLLFSTYLSAVGILILLLISVMMSSAYLSERRRKKI